MLKIIAAPFDNHSYQVSSTHITQLPQGEVAGLDFELFYFPSFYTKTSFLNSPGPIGEPYQYFVNYGLIIYHAVNNIFPYM